MGLSFHCPQCSQAVPALPTQMGQQVTCPACKAQFRLSPALLGGNGQSAAVKAPPVVARHAAPPVAAAVPPLASPAPPVATVVKMPPPRPVTTPSPVMSPPPVAAPAPPAHSPLTPHPSPAAKPNVARFIAAASQDSTVQLTAEGKLPELSLAEATAKKQRTSESNTSPLVLGLVLTMSTLASLLLLVVDFSGNTVSSTTADEARQKIEQFYVSPSGTLLPYQELLRESQRAHGRKDYQAEREYYQRVRDLLRSEALKDNYAGLTGTRSGDEELMRLLGVLLSTEGRQQ